MLLFVVYTVVLSFILLYSLVQFILMLNYLLFLKVNPTVVVDKLDKFPMVTIQLPIYNEKYVIERLIDAVVLIQWPKECLEIQLLDDSDDETSSIAEKKVNHYRLQGFDIQHIRRVERVGYKAGALAYGMSVAKGDYMAIFDADFLPAANFLKQTICHFDDLSVGVVQTKWTHLNPNFSLLTKLQGFGLNNHFNVEQCGRSYAGCFINFNGTAGIWRKSCIEDAGGWQSDTLTEDLDLSYRAQLKGWRFIYRNDIESPAELPITIDALKNQQFRWSKGAAECARKNLNKVIFSKQMSLFDKVNAFFHLTNSIMFLCMLVLIFLSVPLMYFSLVSPLLSSYLVLTNVFMVSSVLLAATYFVSNFNSEKPIKSSLDFIYIFPFFLAMCMGIALFVSGGVVKGFIGIRSEFVRTPKFNVVNRKSSLKNTYSIPKINFVFFVESALLLYAFLGLYYSIINGFFSMVFFLLLIVIGAGYSSLHTFKNAFFKKI